MRDIKAIFCDIDGTLLNDDKTMPEKNIYAIKKLEEKGIPFIICTARGPMACTSLYKEYNLSCPLISYSGALIEDSNKKILYKKGLNRNLVQDIINHVKKSKWDTNYCIYSTKKWLCEYKEDERLKLEESLVKAQATTGKLEDIEQNDAIGKLFFLCNENEDVKIKEYIEKKFDTVRVVCSFNRLIDIMPSDINKGQALREMCKIMGIDPQNTMAFGDTDNDIDMLLASGHGFLMANANKSLHSLVKNIAPSNEEAGVYETLRKYKLI